MNEKLTVHPLRDHVVIERKQLTKTKAGLILPDTAEEAFQVFCVRVGPDVKDVKPGDMVQLGAEGHITWVNGSEEKLAIVAEEQIIAKLEICPDLQVV